MKPQCQSIRNTLADDGASALQQNAAAQAHIAECDGCFSFLEALTSIEEGLHDLGSHDVADDVVTTLLARPELTQTPHPDPVPSRLRQLVATIGDWMRPRPLVWSSVAGAFMIVAVAFVLRSEGTLEIPESQLIARKELVAKGDSLPAPAAPPLSKPSQRNSNRELDSEAIRKLTAFGYLGNDLVLNEKKLLEVGAHDQDKQESMSRFSDDFIANLPTPGRSYRDVLKEASGIQDNVGDRKSGTPKNNIDLRTESRLGRTDTDPIEELEVVTRGSGVEHRQKAGQTFDPIHRVAPQYPEGAKAAAIEATVTLQITLSPAGRVSAVERVVKCDRPGIGFEQAAIDAVLQWEYEPALENGTAIDRHMQIDVQFTLDGDEQSLLQQQPPIRAAQAFLAERERVEGLAYQSATGYWSNSYLPGDPTMRLLTSRLADGLQLHEAAHRIGQPFDSPDGAALAVYIQADRRGLSQSGRMLLQVGIKGTPRHGGRRPSMNVAVVLDLRDALSQDSARAVRALVEAFNRAKEPGDRFRLLVAGREGQTLIEPDDFRHGFLKVTLDRLIATPPALTSELATTLAKAIALVTAADDADAPLGSNAVMFVTSRPLGMELDQLVALAHRGAVAGVQLSAIGIGANARLDEIGRLALAGQGNRRVLDTPAAAAKLVDQELASASRAIARAVRLRIRLAPGVKLVDVIGADPLDQQRAQRVRDAERSIDLRLARQLGIEADRGEDEEGIQIVIPSFYAGDSHVVLLDVVAAGPGAIADVTLRYKDLAQLKNNVARASLALGRDTSPRGPLEYNVMKNLLSRRLADCLDEAARHLRSGDTQRAVSAIDGFSQLIEGLRQELPGFGNDAELAADIALLSGYRTALSSGLAQHTTQQQWLADSLALAAKFKLLPRPTEVIS